MIFKKEVPQLWISFGNLDRRKVTDVEEDTSFVYNTVCREPIARDSFAVILLPEQRVLQHVPVGYHLRITYLDKGNISYLLNCTLRALKM